LYIRETLKSKRRDDLSLQFYASKQLETTFCEIFLRNQPNMIASCIYKHPRMSIDDSINYF